MHDSGKALAHRCSRTFAFCHRDREPVLTATLRLPPSFLETDACWLKMVKSHMASKHRDTWGEVTAGTCAIGDGAQSAL